VVRRARDGAPTRGASQNSHSWPIAQPPAYSAGPVERAGFTDVLVTGMLTRWMIVSVSPIASGANPPGARASVTPMITYRKTAVSTISTSSPAPRL